MPHSGAALSDWFTAVAACVVAGIGFLGILSLDFVPHVTMHYPLTGDSRGFWTWPNRQPENAYGTVSFAVEFVRPFAASTWWFGTCLALFMVLRRRAISWSTWLGIGAILGGLGLVANSWQTVSTPLISLGCAIAMRPLYGRLTAKPTLIFAALGLPLVAALLRRAIHVYDGETLGIRGLGAPLEYAANLLFAGPYAVLVWVPLTLLAAAIAECPRWKVTTAQEVAVTGALLVLAQAAVRFVWAIADNPRGRPSTAIDGLVAGPAARGSYRREWYDFDFIAPFPPTSWQWLLTAAPDSGTPLAVIAGCGWALLITGLVLSAGAYTAGSVVGRAVCGVVGGVGAISVPAWVVHAATYSPSSVLAGDLWSLVWVRLGVTLIAGLIMAAWLRARTRASSPVAPSASASGDDSP